MIKKILYICVILLVSCKSSSLYLSTDGIYEKKGEDYMYMLDLNPDNTFELVEHHLDVRTACNGEWVFSSDNKILLKCYEGKETDVLLSSYMTEREVEVKVLGKKKIEYKGVVLKKTNR